MMASKMMEATLVLSIVLAGCFAVAGDEVAEPNARGQPADEIVLAGSAPALTVLDMSGELPHTSVGFDGIGNGVGILFNAGTVPAREGGNGSILVDFQPNLGLATTEVWICIGRPYLHLSLESPTAPDCNAYRSSTGEAVQVDATDLVGKTIFVGADDGAGTGTTYVLCTSVFDDRKPSPGYTAIVDGRCHDLAFAEDETLYLRDVVVEANAMEPDCDQAEVFGMGPDSGSDARVPARISNPMSSCTTYFHYQATESFTLSGSIAVRFWYACDQPKPGIDVWDHTFEVLLYRNGDRITGTAGPIIFVGDIHLCLTEATQVRIEAPLLRPVPFASGDELTLGIEEYYVNDADAPGYLYYLVGPSHPSGIAAPGLPVQAEEPGTAAADLDAQAPQSKAAPAVALAATSALALILAGYFWPTLKYGATSAAILIRGYAKVRKDDVLNNETRDKLLRAIQAEPGVTPPELHRLIGGGWSTVVYHLGVLEKNNLVSSLVDGRHKRFFPADSIDFAKRDQVAALKNARTKAAYDLVLKKPGIIQKSIAQHLGIAPQSSSWHLRRLEKAGLLERKKVGRKTHYYAKPGQPFRDVLRLVDGN